MMKHTLFHAYMDTSAMQLYQVYVLNMLLFSAVHAYMYMHNSSLSSIQFS